MIEPVALKDFFLAFFSAAMVVLAGAFYALLFAYARVKRRPRLMPLAYAAYFVLAASALALGVVANLFSTVFWSFVVVLMLAGYLLAPHAVWYLCVGTHAQAHEGEPSTALRQSTLE
jgi:hypothetical protein